MYIATSKNGARNWQIRPDGRVIEVMVVPNGTITMFASPQLTAKTIIVKANGGMQNTELTTLPDARRPIMNAGCIAHTPTIRHAAPAKTSAPAATKSKAPATQPSNHLHVSSKRTKITQDGVYSNIFVNGKQIIKNHVNTTMTTFFDGRLLGVNGIVTDDERIPTRPVWKLYDTNTHEYQIPYQSQFNGNKVFIMNIVPQVPDKLKLYLSNSICVILKLEQYKSISDKIFVIDNSKTK